MSTKRSGAGRSTVPNRRASTPPLEPPVNTVDLFDGNPEHAWKALGLIVDWIKHAETKAGATLAAAGVVGGVLFNLVKGVNQIGALLAIASVLCAVAVVAAGASAAIALAPRMGARGDVPTSPLYYKHIAKKHPAQPHTYFEDFNRLTASREDLVREIAEQVWANSHVALRNYTWGSRAVACLVAGLISLAWVALVLAIQSLGG